MVRPAKINNEDILQAAREVFLANGVQATTSQVAERAGVSEGTLFKRFGSKVELFVAALTPEEDAPEFILTLEAMQDTDCLHETMIKSGMEAIEYFNVVIPLNMMVWSNPQICNTASCDKFGPIDALRRGSAVMEQQMEKGKVRADTKPIYLAHAFYGAIKNYVAFNIMYGDDLEKTMTDEEFVIGLLETIWRGVQPADQQ